MNKLTLFVSTIIFSLFFIGCSEKAQDSTTSTPSSEESAKNESAASGAESTYSVQAGSQINWKGSMMGMYAHEGTLNVSEGTITVKDGQVTGGSFTVDMASMTATDGNYNEAEGKTKEKLIGHLSSADFFDVANHPKASFKISAAAGDVVKGELTIKGTSNMVAIEKVTVAETGDGLTASGYLKINRQNFDVKWSHPMKEMVLSDDIELNIELTATK